MKYIQMYLIEKYLKRKLNNVDTQLRFSSDVERQKLILEIIQDLGSMGTYTMGK
tara:strand:- start:1512 stop:1673 length:162 start_codon:yes stop_codon:yes gene_type:complete